MSKTPDRAEIETMVIDTIQQAAAQTAKAARPAVDKSTVLLGAGAVLDSLGLVTALIDLEQRLEPKYSRAITITDERAMSQARSPFRTVETLSEYILTLLSEGQP